MSEHEVIVVAFEDETTAEQVLDALSGRGGEQSRIDIFTDFRDAPLLERV